LERLLNKATSLKEKKSIIITKKQRQMLDDLLKNNPENMKVGEFMEWARNNFQIEEFYLNFELVPLPTTESAVILDILQRSDAQSQVADHSWYVLSYRWWELWRSYIHNDFNKIAQLKKKYNKGKSKKKNGKTELEEQKLPEIEDDGEIADENIDSNIFLEKIKMPKNHYELEDTIPATNEKKTEDNVGELFKQEMKKISKDILSGKELKNEEVVNFESPLAKDNKNVIVSK
jgi:hypothetical protein